MVTEKKVGPHPHIHWILQIKAPDLVVEESRQTMHYYKDASIENITNDLTKNFEFVEYEKHYALYKDGATEYVRLEGTCHSADELFKVTCDVFTCYCEPLNENTEPPF